MSLLFHLALAGLLSVPIHLPRTHQDASDWPHWMGPNRNGVVADDDWSSEGAAEPLWSAEVGQGYSCPTIAGGKLYTMGFDEEAELDHVLCLDALTGEEEWRHVYPAKQRANFHEGGTLTSPVVADGVVYTVNREGSAYALDAESGEVLWERRYREELELKGSFHGYSASPLVLGERFVLVLGGVVAAFEAWDGALLWRSEDYGDMGYSNPVPIERDGKACVAAIPGKTFVVLDLETGAVRHEHPWDPKGNGVTCGTPLVTGERVFLSTAYDKGCTLLELGEEVAPKVLWESRVMRNKVTSCFRFEDHIYGFDESMLKCIDLEGEEAWRVRGLGLGALSIAGGRLLVLSDEGELIIAKAGPEGFEELARKQVLESGECWTMPVLVGGLIYCRNSKGQLVCLDHRAQVEAGEEDK